MCSFIAIHRSAQEIDKEANRLARFRGPDTTTVAEIEGWTVLHNLLSLTGKFTPQPFLSEDKKRVCFFNGEIYNWRTIDPSASSDGEILLPLYEKEGMEFVKKLDGEFALVILDFQKDHVLFSCDAFGTKPLWFGVENGVFGVATYESSLKALGISRPEKVSANTTLLYSMSSGTCISKSSIYTFDPSRQHKKDVTDFLTAFSESIAKRAKGAREEIFIGLSSGYDSGAIAIELERQHIPFHAYSIYGRENRGIIQARHALMKSGSGTILDAGYAAYQRAKKELQERCEPFEGALHPRYAEKSILDDSGAIGLGIICKKAEKAGYKIYLSGQGADEILSDYRMHGHGLTGHSTVEGKFPDDLTSQFPWHNFYEGAQKFYIAKEEHVAGAYGIEARYPYLDTKVVQEYLYLAPEIKNADYKYPLKVLFEAHKYPFVPNVKVGFIPRKKTISDYIQRVLNAIQGRHV